MRGQAKVREAKEAPKEATETSVEADEAQVEVETEPRSAPAPVLEEPSPALPTPDPARTKEKEVVPRALRELRNAESQSLLEYLQSFGERGSLRVQINRVKPTLLRVNGREYTTEGHLETVDEAIDEAYLQENWGGGTYDLTIKTRGGTGSYHYSGHRVVKVAGDPKVDRLPSNAQAPAAATSSDPNTTMVKEVMGLVKDQLHQAAKPDGIPPSVQLVIDQMREDRARLEKQMERRDEELREMRVKISTPPPADTLKDDMLKGLMTGQSGHVEALRLRYEAEIRQIKEGISQDQKRIEDRHDRTVMDMRQSHERQLSEMRQHHELTISNLKASYEREIAALNLSHQTMAAAAASSKEVTVTTLGAENRRLSTENQTLREENRALRDRKDLTPMQMIKEFKGLKEAMGTEDGGEDSTAEKVITALPAVVAGIGDVIKNARAAPQAPQAAQAVAARRQPLPRRVVAAPDNTRFIQEPTGQLTPVKIKPKVITTDAGTQIEIPKIDAPTLTLLISMLESSFGRDEDPRIVAQTGRSMIPQDVLAWIREQTTEQVSGVDLFMQKVAKLPGTSPLATLAGKNWLRQVGRVLIGAEVEAPPT